MNVGVAVILTMFAATWISVQAVIWSRLFRQPEFDALLAWRMRLSGIGVSLVLLGLIPLLAMYSRTAHVFGEALLIAGVAVCVVAKVLTYVFLWRKRFSRERD